MKTNIWKLNKDIPEYTFNNCIEFWGWQSAPSLSEDHNTVIEKRSNIDNEEFRDKGKN